MRSLSTILRRLALAGVICFAGSASAQTIDQLRSTKTLRIAYGSDAPPFSYIPPGSPATAAPQGYSVDLCRAAATATSASRSIRR